MNPVDSFVFKKLPIDKPTYTSTITPKVKNQYICLFFCKRRNLWVYETATVHVDIETERTILVLNSKMLNNASAENFSVIQDALLKQINGDNLIFRSGKNDTAFGYINQIIKKVISESQHLLGLEQTTYLLTLLYFRNGTLNISQNTDKPLFLYRTSNKFTRISNYNKDNYENYAATLKLEHNDIVILPKTKSLNSSIRESIEAGIALDHSDFLFWATLIETKTKPPKRISKKRYATIIMLIISSIIVYYSLTKENNKSKTSTNQSNKNFLKIPFLPTPKMSPENALKIKYSGKLQEQLSIIESQQGEIFKKRLKLLQEDSSNNINEVEQLTEEYIRIEKEKKKLINIYK